MWSEESAGDPEVAARREQLVELYREASGCTKCPLAETRTKVVFGAGDADADLMFVGEAPGAEEDRQGLPFVGRAGGLLNELLEGIGLSREDVFIAQRAQVPPPGQPRSAAGRDRGLPAVPVEAGRADRAAGRRDARQLRDEAADRQPDRDHPGSRHAAGAHARRPHGVRLPAPAPGRGAAHAEDEGDADRGLRRLRELLARAAARGAGEEWEEPAPEAARAPSAPPAEEPDPSSSTSSGPAEPAGARSLRSEPAARPPIAETTDSDGPAETEALAARARRLACDPATSCSSQRRARRRQDDLRPRRRRALGVAGRSPRRPSRSASVYPGAPCRSPTSTSTGSARSPRRSPGCSTTTSTADAIAFVEWPRRPSARELERVAARVRIEHARRRPRRHGSRSSRRGCGGLMSLTLALDTATPDTAVAVCDGLPRLLSERRVGPGAGRPAQPRAGAARARSPRSVDEDGGWERVERDRRRRRARARSPGSGSASRPRGRWRRRAACRSPAVADDRRARGRDPGRAPARAAARRASTRAAARSSRRCCGPARRSPTPPVVLAPDAAGRGAFRPPGGRWRRATGRYDSATSWRPLESRSSPTRTRPTGSRPVTVSALVPALGTAERPRNVKPLYLRRPDAERWRERDRRDR